MLHVDFPDKEAAVLGHLSAKETVLQTFTQT